MFTTVLIAANCVAVVLLSLAQITYMKGIREQEKRRKHLHLAQQHSVIDALVVNIIARHMREQQKEGKGNGTV